MACSLYKGKPFKSKNWYEKENDPMLFADDAIKIGEDLFLFANNLNMLFSINLLDGKLTFLGGIPEKHIFSKGLTCKLIYLEDHIIVVPLLARKIWIYSLKSKKWRDIAIEECKVYGRGTYFRQVIRYKDSLFFIGGHYPAIVKMDLLSEKLIYLKQPFLNCAKQKEPGELYFRGDFVYKKDTLYLASGRDNTVLEYHLDTQTYQWIEIGKEDNRYSGIMWDGNNYWLSPRKNTPIVKWDGYDRVTEYEIPEEKRVDGIAYAGIIKRNNQIIIPALARSDADTIILNSDGSMEFDKKKYFFYKKTDEGDYIAQELDGHVLIIDAKGKKKKCGCKLSDENLSSLLNVVNVDMNDTADIINEENGLFSLNFLFKLIGRIGASSVQSEKNIGVRMWKEIKL